MVAETWILVVASDGGNSGPDLGSLRLLRLLRLSRMVRLMRSVPELLTLVKGMMAATRSVFSTLVLLVLFIYVFGIIFTGLYRCESGDCPDIDPDMIAYFGSMGQSMFTLFVSGTLL